MACWASMPLRLHTPGSGRVQLLEKSEDEDREQRQNEVFWKIDLGATDKDLKDAPLDRGARLACVPLAPRTYE